MDKLLIIIILGIIYICIKDEKNISPKNKIEKDKDVDLTKITYAHENLHYEEEISDFLEHIEECDGD